MKKLLLILLLPVGHFLHAQSTTVQSLAPQNTSRWHNEFGIYYSYSNPTGSMGTIIQQGHGGGIYYGWVNPNERFAFGLDFAMAQYGHDKSRQEYEMDDGTLAPMDIVVSNTFMNFMGYARWYLATKGVVRPYLVGKLGYTWFRTDLNIYDPDDWDHCEPVDKDVLYKDGTVLVAAGAGLKIDLAFVFKKLKTSKFYLDSNINFVQGGDVRYMNADADPHHHKPAPDVGHVTAEFINTQTQIVHKHHVGHLYESAVQMTEIRVGFSMNISR